MGRPIRCNNDLNNLSKLKRRLLIEEGEKQLNSFGETC